MTVGLAAIRIVRSLPLVVFVVFVFVLMTFFRTVVGVAAVLVALRAFARRIGVVSHLIFVFLLQLLTFAVFL